MEEWKPLPADERYSVSSEGRVRGPDGDLVSLGDNGGGYLYFRHGLVHRAVCAVFMGPIPRGMTVNHINGDKRDNRVANLEVVTQGENAKHSYRELGRQPAGVVAPERRSLQIGERHPRSKLKAEDVRDIRHRIAAGEMKTQIAERFGVTPAYVTHIDKRRSWAHLP